MKVSLKKADLICLLIGCPPKFHVFNEPEVRELGKVNKEGWSWDKEKLFTLPNKELFELYKFCKSSWI